MFILFVEIDLADVDRFLEAAKRGDNREVC